MPQAEFDAAAAFGQITLLILGCTFLLAGGAIAAYALYWLLRATRIPAVIAGVRKKGAIFYPVYRYEMPEGRIWETTSDTGSSLLLGKETGRAVTLLVFPEDPQTVRRGVTGMALLGLLACLPGLWLVRKSLTDYDWTFMTWAALAVFAVVAVQRLMRLFGPRREGRGGLSRWQQAIRAKRREMIEGIPVQRLEEYAATPEGRLETLRMREANRLGGPVLLAAGGAMILAGLYFGNRLQALALYGERAEGTVTAQERAGDEIFPVVSFQDETGESHSFRDRRGEAAPARDGAGLPYAVGDAVPVLYRADNPAGSARIDRGFSDWILPAFLLFGGTLVLVVGAGAFIAARRDRRGG